MIETLAALLFAHVLADFVLQTDSMAAGKRGRNPAAMAQHIGIVGLTAVLLVGLPQAAPWPLLALVVAHLVIDWAKSHAPDTTGAFLADQAAHLAVLAVAAAWGSTLWQSGLLAGLPWLPGTMLVAAGAILATRAGGFAIGLLMRPWSGDAPKGLANGGRLIGNLERGLIFILVMAGQPGSIGFLIAAKSVLRFETVKQDTRAAEYVIVGTLASFAWAIAAAYATLALNQSLASPLAFLPRLGIPPAIP